MKHHFITLSAMLLIGSSVAWGQTCQCTCPCESNTTTAVTTPTTPPPATVEPFACTAEEIKAFLPKEALLAKNNEIASLYLLPSTAQVNKGAKTVKIWILRVVTPAGREKYLADFGGDYGELGYTKELVVYDIKNNTSANLSYESFNCTKGQIDIDKTSNPAEPITPESLGAGAIETLKSKYHL